MTTKNAEVILNEIGGRVLAGATYRLGDRPEGLIKAASLPLLIESGSERLGVATGIYGNDVRALQLVLPEGDAGFAMPWEVANPAQQCLSGNDWSEIRAVNLR